MPLWLSFSGGHYDFPVHLAPKASQGFNVSEIIASQVPDSQGNVIPASVHDGSMKIVGSQADNQAILVAVDDGVYNVQKATCSPPQCYECDGERQSTVQASPFGVPVSGSNQLHWTLTWNTGAQYDYTSMNGTNWMSDHTSVATVQTGLVHGVSPGSATMSAYYSGFVPGYAAQICVYGTSPCPAGGSSSGGSSGTVQVPTSLSIVAGTDSTTTEASCAGGTGCGCTRSFTYQVNDQNGSPILQAGLNVWDSISTSSPNNLNLQSYNTTCTPANTGSCGVATDANGQFREASLGACAPVCKSNNMCVTGGPTNANQTWHVGSAAIVKQVGYYCNHVTVQ